MTATVATCLILTFGIYPVLAQVPGIQDGVAFLKPPPIAGAAPSRAEWYAVFQNKGASPLEAFFVRYDCPKPSKVIEYDGLFEFFSPHGVIPPSGNVELPAGDPAKCTGGTKAAIFADGHVEGDPQLLQHLFDRRRGAAAALEVAIPLVNSIAADQNTLQQVVDTLDGRWADAKRAHSDYGVGAATVYSIARDSLKRNSELPEKASKLPTVEELMTKQGLSHNEAFASRLAQKLQLWKTGLAGRLQPPA